MWFRPGVLSAPEDTNPCCVAVWSRYKDRQRLATVVPWCPHDRSTASVSIRWHQRMHCNSLKYRQQVCSPGSAGSPLPARLTPVLCEKETAEIRLIVAEMDDRASNCKQFSLSKEQLDKRSAGHAGIHWIPPILPSCHITENYLSSSIVLYSSLHCQMSPIVMTSSYKGQ